MGRTLLNLFKSYYSQLAKQDSIVVSKNDLIALIYLVIISLVYKAQRKNTVVDKVLSVDTGERFADYKGWRSVRR